VQWADRIMLDPKHMDLISGYLNLSAVSGLVMQTESGPIDR